MRGGQGIREPSSTAAARAFNCHRRTYKTWSPVPGAHHLGANAIIRGIKIRPYAKLGELFGWTGQIYHADRSIAGQDVIECQRRPQRLPLGLLLGKFHERGGEANGGNQLYDAARQWRHLHFPCCELGNMSGTEIVVGRRPSKLRRALGNQ